MRESLPPMPSAPIFINGRFLTQRVTGVQRYGRETLECLDELLAAAQPGTQQSAGGAAAAPELAAPVRWTLLLPPGAPEIVMRHISVRRAGRFGGHLWEQFSLPWHSRGGVLLNFGFTGPLLKSRQVITIHDAAVVRMPQAYGWRFRAWYRLVVGVVAARALRVFTVSHFSASEAQACFGVARERVRVMTEGWQHLERIHADDAVLDRLGVRGRPYALAVSSPTANKNFALIGQALALMGAEAPYCVAVGASDAAVFRDAQQRPDTLHSVGYVSDAELKALYQHATCFVFPSFYEGFGIPALEAMALGCPVLASTAAALRETCADAAGYFDPGQPGELASRLRELFASPARQIQMRAAGLSRAQRYSWARAAQLTLAALREGATGEA